MKQIPWNKNLTKKTDQRIVEYSDKVRSTILSKNLGFQKGYSPWNKGLTKNDRNGLMKISLASSRNNYKKGKKVSKEGRQRIKDAIRKSFENGRPHPKGFLGKHTKEAKTKISIASKAQIRSKERYEKISKALAGRKLSENHKKSISKSCKKYFATAEGKDQCRKGALKSILKLKNKRFHDTKPELDMANILESLEITFIHPYPVWNIKHKYPADFYIPETNTILEVDGKHWHNYPYGTEIDLIRNKEMESYGYKVLRFWENEFDEFSVKKSLGGVKFQEDTIYKSNKGVLLNYL